MPDTCCGETPWCRCEPTPHQVTTEALRGLRARPAYCLYWWEGAIRGSIRAEITCPEHGHDHAACRRPYSSDGYELGQVVNAAGELAAERHALVQGIRALVDRYADVAASIQERDHDAGRQAEATAYLNVAGELGALLEQALLSADEAVVT